MTRIFSMADFSLGSAALRKSSSTASRVANLQGRLKMLEGNLAKALMINEALWDFIKQEHRLKDDDLNEKLYMIDMRDGQLDGKNQRSATVKCLDCGRGVSSRHCACIYCGRVIDDSVFRMT